MNFKKYVCFLIILVILISTCGCKKNDVNKNSSDTISNSTPKSVKSSINLLYCYSDKFDPYSATTKINRNLSSLLFDSLVKVTNEFKSEYSLASAATVSNSKCTVTLKDTVFTDGSAVSADDVVYSYHLAKSSPTVYAAKLYEVVSANATDSKTVVFKLSRNDIYFTNLIDFPIIKSGSEKRVNSDSVVLPPIGSGRYYVADDLKSLILNDNYHGEKGSITTINLINAPDAESISHYVEIGATDFFYSDISDGNIQRMSGKKVDVNLNNLVYLGLNDSVSSLSNLYLRYALSSAINRSQICQNSYYNNAVAATGFFNPSWQDVSAVQKIQTKSDSEITIENLEKIGYNNKNANGVLTNAGGDALSFTLLVNSENRLRVAVAQTIADQLKNFGISLTVIEKNYAEYLQCLTTGNFQLYLGEVLITDNMDISPLVIPGGAVSYGLGLMPTVSGEEVSQDIISYNTISSVIDGFYSGSNTINDVAVTLQTQMPVIPVCYRTGIMFYNENIENIKNCSEGDIYFSIESYKIKK